MWAPRNAGPGRGGGARSRKGAGGDPDVGIGPPPSKQKVAPPLVALTGRFPTFWLMAALMNEMSVPLSEFAEGTKWSAWSAVAESEPEPPRNSGSLPAVKMNSSEIFSRRPWAGDGVAASAIDRRLHR